MNILNMEQIILKDKFFGDPNLFLFNLEQAIENEIEYKSKMKRMEDFLILLKNFF